MKTKIEQDIILYLNTSGTASTVNDIKPDQLLLGTGVLDSFSMVELISFVEKTFGVAFAPEDLTRDNLASVSTISGLIMKKLGVIKT